MSLLKLAAEEMKRRSRLLPEEVATWKADIEANIDAQGIHRSQVNALKDMMDELLERQDELLRRLDDNRPLAEFAQNYYRLLFEIAGTNELWRIFRYIFLQRQDKMLGPLVDAADLIAADCYLTGMDQARAWGLVSEDHFREPPLVYLEAEVSPLTASRGWEVQALSLPVHRYRDLRLPIPIVIMPFDHTECLWLYCGLHHEVGHNLDQDLDLRAEVQQHLETQLTSAGVPEARRRVWQQWAGEILADTFGVILGGAGFAHTLAGLFLMLSPINPDLDLVKDHKRHPHPFVRVHLLAALLEQMGVNVFDSAATKIKTDMTAVTTPSWATEYLNDCEEVAGVFMTRKLAVLGDRPVQKLVPDPAGDAQRTQELADYLSSGFLRPDPNLNGPFPWRLVPAAAQLAVTGLADPDPDTLAKIQERSLKYIQAINRPEFLAGVDRKTFLRSLARGIQFQPEEEGE